MTSIRGSVAAPPGIQTRPSRKGAGAPPTDRASWGVPAPLVALSLIPVIAGSLRVLEIAGGPNILPVNPRIDAAVAEWVIRRAVHGKRRARSARTLVG